MRRLLMLLILAAASVVSTGCYVKQDASGKWWACETYATPNGPAEGCYEIDNPF